MISQLNKPLLRIENWLRIDISGAPMHLAAQQKKAMGLMDNLIDTHRVTRTDARVPNGGINFSSGGKLIWSLQKKGAGDGSLEKLKGVLFSVFVEYKEVEAEKTFKLYMNTLHPHPHPHVHHPIHYMEASPYNHPMAGHPLNNPPIHHRISPPPLPANSLHLQHGHIVTPHSPYHYHH